jgi:Xaa-Pro dipeptidase
MMRTAIIGEPSNRHRELYSACREAMQAMEMVLRPGNTFGTVFETFARIIDERGLARHRLNTCGYSVGARFAPSWMEQQMFLVGNPQEIQPNMTLFVHTIVLDSDSGTAMTLGQTYLTTTDTPKALSRYGLDFIEV